MCVPLFHTNHVATTILKKYVAQSWKHAADSTDLAVRTSAGDLFITKVQLLQKRHPSAKYT